MNEPQEGAQAAMKRIGEMLREHELGWSASEGFHCISIICDWYGHDLDFPEHRAELIIAALGLTPEYGVITDMGVTNPYPSRMSREGVQSLAAKYDDITPRTRLVTKWEQQT